MTELETVLRDVVTYAHIGNVVLALVLTAIIGFERELRGKSAGLRTQSIVGTASALFILVSKFGFFDVLGSHVVLDPSRIAAQVVTGIGFLGAGLILTQRGMVIGLTTAATVWEAAAVGMAAGAGLWELAITVTVLHFVIVFGSRYITSHLRIGFGRSVSLEVLYVDGRGLLRDILENLTEAGWSVTHVLNRSHDSDTVSVLLELAGKGDGSSAVSAISGIDGVRSVDVLTHPEEQ